MGQKARQNFGKRKEPHKIVITNGSSTRSYTIRPWLLTSLVLAGALFSVGYLGATGYLIFRDGLLGAALDRQAHMQRAYEDRIASLRTRIDRINSRKLVDQELFEAKISQLLSRQNKITNQHGMIEGLIEKARKRGLAPKAQRAGKGDKSASAPLSLQTLKQYSQAGMSDPIVTGSPKRKIRKTLQLVSPLIAKNEFLVMPSLTQFAKLKKPEAQIGVFRQVASVSDKLEQMFKEQAETIKAIQKNAEKRQKIIKSAFLKINVNPNRFITSNQVTGQGGPFIPLSAYSSDAIPFVTSFKSLEVTLKNLDNLENQLKKYPLRMPMHRPRITSRYGSRVDPLNGRMAFHAGMDFVKPRGTPIHATGKGRVIQAGWRGGYGRSVEIDHGNGLTTRFAHMSSVSVSKGDYVQPGTMIGRLGNTGRSTGPHLHYETRLHGKPVNPARYLQAGRLVRNLL